MMQLTAFDWAMSAFPLILAMPVRGGHDLERWTCSGLVSLPPYRYSNFPPPGVLIFNQRRAFDFRTVWIRHPFHNTPTRIFDPLKQDQSPKLREYQVRSRQIP